MKLKLIASLCTGLTLIAMSCSYATNIYTMKFINKTTTLTRPDRLPEDVNGRWLNVQLIDNTGHVCTFFPLSFPTTTDKDTDPDRKAIEINSAKGPCKSVLSAIISQNRDGEIQDQKIFYLDLGPEPYIVGKGGQAETARATCEKEATAGGAICTGQATTAGATCAITHATAMGACQTKTGEAKTACEKAANEAKATCDKAVTTAKEACDRAVTEKKTSCTKEADAARLDPDEKTRDEKIITITITNTDAKFDGSKLTEFGKFKSTVVTTPGARKPTNESHA